MAALLDLLRASEFYRHAGNIDYSLALHAYAYGLYKDDDVSDRFGEVRARIEQYRWHNYDRILEGSHFDRAHAVVYTSNAERELSLHEPENLNSFWALLDMLGLDDVDRTLLFEIRT